MDVIPMVDLSSQFKNIQNEIDAAIQQCFANADFINGNAVSVFENNLAAYTGIKNVIGCGNGTDALQLALMALDLPKNSKIIVPAFTYIAPAEVVALLRHHIVFADVEDDFNISLENIKAVYTNDVKAIIIVHLFGQPCQDIKTIYSFCLEKNIALIEDNAQSLGAEKNIKRNSIITTSFYPTKNLGAYGDGGAVLCNDDLLSNKIRKIASHGQSKKYIHDIVGINSRLDTIQAAILSIKLKYLDTYNEQRRKNAFYYQTQLNSIVEIELPAITTNHIFHLYTLKIKNGKRNELADFLKNKNITTIINYPKPVYEQQAYFQNITLPNTQSTCACALSIPVYPEISETQMLYICNEIKSFFAKQ